MDWHFRTLGMGTVNYRASARRLSTEAKRTGLFQSSESFTEKYMRKSSPVFWEKHRNVLSAKTPGFGWWIWKPEFIWQSLMSIPEGDGLLYLDAGSTIQSDQDSIAQINQLMKKASAQLVSASNTQPFTEKHYSSIQLMNLLNLSENDRNSNQFWAGCLFLVNCDSTRRLIDEWRFLTCTENHRFLLPTVRLSEEAEGFVHHMHDQAIISCLLKVSKVESIDIGDRDRPGCIRGVRHRFGFSYNESSVYKRMGYLLVHFISRLRLYLLRRIIQDSLTRKPSAHT